MIGNDIVDLKLAKVQSDWQRKGFLTKIFTEKERMMIEDSRDSFQLVWLFWSMKESAYKCYVQEKNIRFFAPKKLQCERISETQGLVSIQDERYYTNSKIRNSYIMTEAIKNPNRTVKHKHFKINDVTSLATSQLVRHKIKTAIATTLDIPIDALSVEKNASGVPKLYQNKKELQVSISMSHHGNFGAYSILNIEG